MNSGASWIKWSELACKVVSNLLSMIDLLSACELLLQTKLELSEIIQRREVCLIKGNKKSSQMSPYRWFNQDYVAAKKHLLQPSGSIHCQSPLPIKIPEMKRDYKYIFWSKKEMHKWLAGRIKYYWLGLRSILALFLDLYHKIEILYPFIL